MIISKKKYEEKFLETQKEIIALLIENEQLKTKNKELEDERLRLLKAHNKTLNLQNKLLNWIEKKSKKRKVK